MVVQSCISQDHPTGTIEQIRGTWRVAVGTACCAIPAPSSTSSTVNADGAIGHSQGAKCVLNALSNRAVRSRPRCPSSCPAQIWCTAHCANMALLTGSVFCVDGNFDPISSPTQNPGITGL
jgi:hypothetical protein